MKKALSLLLVLVMVLSLCSVTAFAAENYTGKTVILYMRRSPLQRRPTKTRVRT